MSKKSKRKAGRVVRRVLSDGTVKEYRYAAHKAAPRVAHDSIEALIRAYKQSPAWHGLSERTRTGRTAYFREFEEIGHLPVRDITRRDILEIRDAIAGQRGNGAAGNFKQAASVLFGWAVDQDWIQHSPVHRLRKLPTGSLPAWTDEQARAALAGLPERLRRVVVLGLYTGQRNGDLCAARWSDYDGETIRFVQAKTGAELALAVHPDLKAELDAWERDAPTILINAWGKPWVQNTLSIVLPRALRPLGLPKGMNVHGMRKLFAAGMAEGGATEKEIAANTGHRTLSMVQLYTSSANQQKLSRQAVVKIQSRTNAKKT